LLAEADKDFSDDNEFMLDADDGLIAKNEEYLFGDCDV